MNELNRECCFLILQVHSISEGSVFFQIIVGLQSGIGVIKVNKKNQLNSIVYDIYSTHNC